MPKLDNAPGGAPSRRALLQGATALALPAPAPPPESDAALAVCKQLRSLDRERRRLLLQWQAVESWLFRERNWPALSATEQREAPEAARLEAIDAQVDRLHEEQEALLTLLQTTPARTRAGVMAKFDALLGVLDAADHPEARALCNGCQRDLNRLWI